jgi:hypothetical protein
MTLKVQIAVMLAFAPVVWGQGTHAKANLESQLRSAYPWTSVRGSAAEIVTPGCVLVVRREGISTNPALAPFNAPNNYKDGRVRPSASSILKQDLQTAGRLQAGDRVYVTKTEVKDTSVILSLLSVEGIQVNGYRAKAAVSFQFPKGFLVGADIGEVTRVIDELLGMEGPPVSQAPPPPPTRQTDQRVPQQAAPPPPPQQAPATIDLGMTYDQVKAVLGPPKRIADVGDKKIYFYPDMKVTFVGGVVKDVE